MENIKQEEQKPLRVTWSISDGMKFGFGFGFGIFLWVIFSSVAILFLGSLILKSFI